MNIDKMTLLQNLIEKHLDNPLERIAPESITPEKTLQILWPLFDMFRPHAHQIQTEPYQAKYETKADEALLAYIEKPEASTWESLPVATWRVLLERQMQMLVTAEANRIQGIKEFMPLPPGLPESVHLSVAILFWLYQMELPWPPSDKPDVVFPSGSLEAYLQQH